MGNLITTQGLGYINAYADRVNDSDPANAVLVLALWTGTETDDNLGDADTFTAVAATSVTESTATNYARIVLDDTDISGTVVDDATNTRTFDIADQVWSSLGPGTAITRLIVGYDSDSTAGTDANIIPLAIYDFSITPNGGDVTAQPSASGLWSAARA